ncbi:uncharacterized protein TNCV_315711 [Trichonephila clavipes]|nr:uncharacterized protein TNCV_315711 [Trichonephila clavipes]
MRHRNLYKCIAKTIYNKKAISAEKSILGENSTSQCYVEAKTRHRVSLVSAHVTTLEEDLKQQPLCQDSPKDVLSDSGLRSSWPFHSFQTVILYSQQSSVRSCIIIHQNEVVTNSSSIGRTYGSRISSRYLRPVTVPPWNTCRSVSSEIPAQTRIPPPL